MNLVFSYLQPIAFFSAGAISASVFLTFTFPERIERAVAMWGGYYCQAVKHSGLSGRDGTLSHTKVFGYAVLISYLVGSTLPASVAIALILSAHGTKVIVEAIHAGVFGLKVNDATNLNIARAKTETTTHIIDERIGWNAEREFQES